MDILNLRRNVALVAKNAPDFIVEQALVDAVQQLCVEAEVWQSMVEIDTSAGDSEITISPPTGASVVRVMWATLGVRKLSAVDHATYATAFTNSSMASPEYYYQVNSQNLEVYPTPFEGEVGQARVVCRLREGSTNFPDDLYSLYKEQIVFGALAKVLSAPGDFGNPAASAQYEQRWMMAVNTAKGRATRSKDNTALVATYGGY
jgi:hypothetical protein